jgi:hypothetical protein
MTSQDQDRESTIEQAVEGVARIGRLWAVYGLEVGRAALRTSSETLKTTSEILGEVAKRIDERKPEPATETEIEQPA